jgi:predicted dehydrogenase
MIDHVVDLFGPPRQVSGWLRHHGPFDDGLADNTLAVLDFDGAMAEVYIAAMQPNGNSYRTFEILGTRGTATVTPFSPDGGLYTDFAHKTGPYPPGRHPVPLSIPQWKGPYEPDFAEMFGIIRRGEKPRYTREHDLAVQKAVLEACRLPAKNRGLNFTLETPR